MKSFEIDLPARGGAVHVLEWGPAERPVDLVFLHANGFNARTYRALLEPLGDALRVVAFDQRGHGLTTLPTKTEGRSDWIDLRDDALAVLQAVEAQGAVLAGHSMGGTVSILAAAAQPGLARSLVLFDPVVVPTASRRVEPNSPMVVAALRRRAVFDSREAVARSYRGRGAFSTWPDEMLADYLVDGFRDLPGGRVELSCAPAWEASNYAVHEHDTRGAIAVLRHPTKIYKAETASTCSLTCEEVEAWPLLSMEAVPGATHFLPMERPDLIDAALVAATS